ncbi:unnamed protein product, partial [Medioppia subpectinata]
TAFVEWKSPPLPQYQPRTIRWRKRALYGLERSWSQEFQTVNAPNIPLPTVYVEPIKHFYIFRGDRVEVLVGRDKGKHGIVNYVVTERNWVCVEGLHLKYKTESKSHDYPGMMVSTERPLLVP